MKTKKLLIFTLLGVATVAFSCKKDKTPETVPTVVTNAPTNITTNTASVSGKISNDGNSSITEAGFVYSYVVAEPTTADNKITVTNFDTFTAELSGLTSGKIYKIRAYAINSQGTGYGELRTFETGNQAPVVTNVQITGELKGDKEVTAAYTYSDAESDAESGTTFQWYVANDAAGAGVTAITGATSKTFIIQDAQNGKYLRVAVTPKSATGTQTGVTVNSSFMGAVGEATTITFTYNGQQVTYGIITSATTQKKWLDRNLGASRVAESLTDYQAYGDLFQWGRAADGHQLVARINGTDAGATGVNGTIDQTSSTNTPSTNKFIVNLDFGERDWRVPANINLWQGVNGVNNPCPVGWRIPIQADWIAENLGTSANAFTVLKLTRTGRRNVEDGTFVNTGSAGHYWSSSPYTDDPQNLSYTMNLGSSGAISVGPTTRAPRGSGYAVRCIKD